MSTRIHGRADSLVVLLADVAVTELFSHEGVGDGIRFSDATGTGGATYPYSDTSCGRLP